MKSKKHFILYTIWLILELLFLLLLPLYYSKDIPAIDLYSEISLLGLWIISLLILFFYRIKKEDYTYTKGNSFIFNGIIWILLFSFNLKRTINNYNFRKSLNDTNYNLQLKYYQFQILSIKIIIILLFINTLFLLLYKIFIKNKK